MAITWDYGVFSHHFKGPRDGIGSAVKRKVYGRAATARVVIQDTKHFAE